MSDASSLAARYRRWFTYECAAQGRVVESLQSVPRDRRDSVEYRKAVSLFGHLVAARRAWLGRLGGAPPFTGQLFPDPATADLDAFVASWTEIEPAWTSYLESLTDAELARAFEYRSFDGASWRNTIEDVLTQLLTHAPYHRGQIASLVRASGGEPAKTDFIFFCREALPS